jgi:hypothetical protein
MKGLTGQWRWNRGSPERGLRILCAGKEINLPVFFVTDLTRKLPAEGPHLPQQEGFPQRHQEEKRKESPGESFLALLFAAFSRAWPLFGK